MQLKKFSIEKIFGRFSIELRFVNNILILVGENGSGKSTALTILYYFLTKQWSRLAEMPFESITALIDDQKLSITPRQLREGLAHSGRTSGPWEYLRRRVGFVKAEHLSALLAEHSPEYWLTSRERILDLSKIYDVDPDLLFTILERGIFERERDPKKSATQLSKIANDLESKLDCEILFLPTYRRIERDLKFIFPDIKIDRDTRTFYRSNAEKGGFVELVEFGMKDVEAAFTSAMQRLDRDFRADLNTLTGEYLRDVIRGAHNKADYAALIASQPSTVDSIVARMNDAILPSHDRRELSLLMTSIRQTGQIPKGKEVVAHFLSMLVRIHERQQSREDRVRRLVDLCNSYLTGKHLFFDPLQFELRFVLEATSNNKKPRPLPPDALSSGEKQIVSLFTHIYLSGRGRYLVIIDEPELSISVEWQRRFLQDIISTELCIGLVAVTHSPFVFENNLSKYAHSMAEFISN